MMKSRGFVVLAAIKSRIDDRFVRAAHARLRNLGGRRDHALRLWVPFMNRISQC